MFIFIIFSLLTQKNYPKWFLRMPVHQNETYFVVGYAPHYAYLSSSFKEAREDIKRESAFIIRTRITGERGFIKGGPETAYMGETIKEYPDTEAVKEINITVLDSVVVKGMVLMLAEIGNKSKKKYHLFSSPTNWWEKLPEQKGYIFAVGGSPIYYYEHNSWKEAEHNARIALAMEIYTGVKSLRAYAGEMNKGITQESVNVVLEGAQIVARHIDKEKGICYVLIRQGVAGKR